MKIKIGTRKSPLALAQTAIVERELKAKFPDLETEIINISTLGDKVQNCPIDKIGGKGVFSGDIEAALKSGAVDIAVHSAKDLPICLAEGLEISGVTKRGNYRDMLIFRREYSESDLKNTDIFLVGTGSPRRRSELSRHFPNAVFGNIRGNVDTRLKKLSNGEFDAIMLCAAGIERLGIPLGEFNTRVFEYPEVLPAPCQGIIAVECACGSTAAGLARAISDRDTMLCFETERAVIAALGADCSAPIGAFSEIIEDKIHVVLSDKSGNRAEGYAKITDRLRLVEELKESL